MLLPTGTTDFIPVFSLKRKYKLLKHGLQVKMRKIFFFFFVPSLLISYFKMFLHGEPGVGEECL